MSNKNRNLENKWSFVVAVDGSSQEEGAVAGHYFQTLVPARVLVPAKSLDYIISSSHMTVSDTRRGL